MSYAGALGCLTVSLSPIQNEFSPNFETKPHQGLNTNLVHHSTLYKNSKSSRGFLSLDREGTAVQVDQILGAREQCFSARFCIFHTLALKISSANLHKVVFLVKVHIFLLGDFGVFRGILENVAKFYNDTKGSKGKLGF
jgi:hypothetical protein